MRREDRTSGVFGATETQDCSITYGGTLSDAQESEIELLAEVLEEVRHEAVRRGWTGARITAVRCVMLHRQIEIEPADQWALTVDDLQAISSRRQRDGA